jgi:hypothetical protein
VAKKAKVPNAEWGTAVIVLKKVLDTKKVVKSYPKYTKAKAIQTTFMATQNNPS